MARLIDWLEEASEGQPILGIVLGNRPYRGNSWPEYTAARLMSYEEAMPVLLIEFDNGFGMPGNPSMHAWTKDWVIGTDQFDGSTNWFRIPRNPCDCYPCEPGG